MNAILQPMPLQADEKHHADADPVLDWMWPVAPATLTVYDKYSAAHYLIRADEPSWTFSYKGHAETIVFAGGRHGELQRRLALLMAGRNASSTVHRNARLLVQNWDTAVVLLYTQPEALKATWDTHARTAVLAGFCKKLLKLACSALVGHWSKRLLPLVNSLDTRANGAMSRRTSHREARQGLVSPAQQANIVSVLDTAATDADLSLLHLEGAAALALIFQHGVRPVQVLRLDVKHVRFFQDASDDLACVVSFHSAKQREAKDFEIVRQIKPEWAPLIERLHANAIRAGRARLFDTSNSTSLWFRVRRLCEGAGIELTCTAPQLRHTGAQALADAGHSRKSIQHYLGHGYEHSAAIYVRASLQQAELINSALGTSKLYGAIRCIALKDYVTLDEVPAADEDRQIGGIVGDSLIAGIGLCGTGQSHRHYNPVTSCYGCPKFMPSLERKAHLEAIESMRQQVKRYLTPDVQPQSPAYRQLIRALAGAQQAIDTIEQSHLSDA
ncbi:phage integrase family protein [Paraburkholderia sp. BL8N3]|nr:site-specific integrase [Paraburkholderia sp. BL8N3]TCK32595.1 phage integrase family protein [Paraburkholderia sp. BL8N3]